MRCGGHTRTKTARGRGSVQEAIEEAAAAAEKAFFSFLEKHGRQDILDGIKVYTGDGVNIFDFNQCEGELGGGFRFGLDVRDLRDGGRCAAITTKRGEVERLYCVALAVSDGRGVGFSIWTELNGRLHDGDNGAAAWEEWQSGITSKSQEREMSLRQTGKVILERSIFWKRQEEHFSQGEKWSPSKDIAAVTQFYPSGGFEEKHFYVDGKPFSDEKSPSSVYYFENGGVCKEEWHAQNGDLHRESGAAAIWYSENGSVREAQIWKNGRLRQADVKKLRSPSWRRGGGDGASQKNVLGGDNKFL